MALFLPLSLAVAPHLFYHACALGAAVAAAAAAVAAAAKAAATKPSVKAALARTSTSKAACTDLAARQAEKYLEVAEHKRLREGREAGYYAQLVVDAKKRAAAKDERQICKDLHRTFEALLPERNTVDVNELLPLLHRILIAYVERGRSLCATSASGMGKALLGGLPHQAATTARPLLTDYPQGLNLLAGLSLVKLLPRRRPVPNGSALAHFLAELRERCGRRLVPNTVVAHCLADLRERCGKRASWLWPAEEQELEMEEAAFWLLASLMEEVLDPDFFGAGACDNARMGYIGGRGLKDLVLLYAEEYCPTMHESMGGDVFQSCLSSVLDQWVLSLFVGCVPERLLTFLWDLLLLPSPYQPLDSVRVGQHRLPVGLATLTAFALAALQCCGEEPLKDSEELGRVANLRQSGMSAEDLELHCLQTMSTIKQSLKSWPEERDDMLMNVAFQQIVSRLADEGTAARLWDQVRMRKQHIAACEEDSEQQLDMLQRQTHYSRHELEELRTNFHNLVGADCGCDSATFLRIMQHVVPQFPQELSDRLFRRLDTFSVGKLSFAELARGLSALALGTTDEKLHVSFDLFDSQGRRALTREDAAWLCFLLFRIWEGTSAEELVPKFLLRLLDEAKASPEGPPVISFEDFRDLVRQQQPLLELFPWCLPPTPSAGTVCVLAPQKSSWWWLWQGVPVSAAVTQAYLELGW